MRAELKIGIAVGLIIALIAVLYVVFHDSTALQEPQELPQPQAELPTPTTPPAPSPSRLLEPVGADALVPAFSGSGQPTPPTAEFAEAPPARRTAQPALVAAPQDTRATEPLAVQVAAPTATTQPAVAAVTPKKPPALEPKPVTVTPAPMVSAAMPRRRTTPATYVVKQGDKGFWGIAETVYGKGKGKYWPLIEKANPQVQSTRLKAGMVLTIPSLPGRLTTPTITTPLATGAERIYVVQPDDGWWMISRKAYGDGKYWKQLRSANPQVEGVLKVGQKIRIPPLADVRLTTPSAPADSDTAEPDSPGRPIFD